MELTHLNHRHDQIAEWLAINGDKTLTECARYFKYTLPWLSQVVNSDMFQALYVEICNERKVAAVHTVANKMSAAASLALDGVIEDLKGGGLLPSQKLETAGQMLDRLGFSAKTATGQGNGSGNITNYFLTPEQLAASRERARDERTVVIEGGAAPE